MGNGPPEYISGFCPTGVERIPWEVMVERGVVYPPDQLRSMLFESHDYLVAIPGQNQQRRKELGFWWFENWDFLLRERRECTAEKQKVILTPFERAADYVDTATQADKTSGVLMMAGGEGTLGHLHAARWVQRHVGVSVLLLESDEYLQRKPRGAPFLPLDMRLSMWYHSKLWSCISVTPLLDLEVVDPVQVNTYYDRVFGNTHAMYSFATEGDPHEKEKRARGKYADFTLIPHFECPDTTTHVARLLPGDE